jgi:hypothetical protein
MHDRAAGPGRRQEAAHDGADDGDEGRRAEVLVLDAVAPEHEDGHVDHREDAQQQQGRGATQGGHAADEGDQAQGQEGREGDGDPRRPSAWMHEA